MSLSCSLFIGLFVCINADQFLDPADDPKNIERPCPDMDMACIREYFAHNSDCRIAEGSMPESVIVEYSKLNLPNCNMTVELYNGTLGGQGNIVEFYTNKETENLLLVIEVQNLNFKSPVSVFRYHRKGKEDVTRTDFVECNYGLATLTVTFPDFCNLDLCEAEVYSYVEDPNPRYTIGPRMRSNLDCIEEGEYQKLVTSIPMDMLEALLTQGKDFIDNYIQHTICDFGI